MTTHYELEGLARSWAWTRTHTELGEKILDPAPGIETFRHLPGCFAFSLRQRDPCDLVLNDDDVPFASTTDHSLSLWESVNGLEFRAFLPPTAASANLVRAIRVGWARHMCLSSANWWLPTENE